VPEKRGRGPKEAPLTALANPDRKDRGKTSHNERRANSAKERSGHTGREKRGHQKIEVLHTTSEDLKVSKSQHMRTGGAPGQRDKKTGVGRMKQETSGRIFKTRKLQESKLS